MGDIPYIEIYKQFCLCAAKNDLTFSSFKNHPNYTPMLEHVTPQQGQDYMNVIQTSYPELLAHMEKFKENDKIGSPNMASYYPYGDISPTTLRYVKTLGDMIQLFETLDGERIIELGGGYGGQCKVISGFCKFADYIIVDLPEVVPLINRYLQATGVPNARAISLSEMEDTTYGLFISNFAFTELPRDLQQTYLDKAVNVSNHGYITCNFISADCGITSMGKDELLGKIKHEYVVIDEYPRTHAANFILAW